MTNQIECIKVGRALPHGALWEITRSLCKDEKLQATLYQKVCTTMKGGVRKMKPLHESIITEARAILTRNEIEQP